MRINEYNSLEEFTDQYIGVWAPSDGHWYGLEFRYAGRCYRLHTGSMYPTDPTHAPDGQEYMFGLYIQQEERKKVRFQRMDSFVSMAELLRYTGIDNRAFCEVIMADETEILGQD